jgi:hypothetical protein
MFTALFILLVVYQLKHFLADYPLQGSYMLGKFKDGWDWVLPLLAHVSVHGLFTLLICLVVRPELWWLALVDVMIHFGMDRIKAGKKYLGRWKPLTANEYIQCQKAMMNDQIIFNSDNGKQIYLDTPTAFEKIRGNTYFWWALGLDQMVHHLTHYFIIWMLVR